VKIPKYDNPGIDPELQAHTAILVCCTKYALCGQDHAKPKSIDAETAGPTG